MSADVAQSLKNFEFFGINLPPKGYIPLSDFYKIYYEEGSPIFAPLRHILPLWLQKVGLYTGLLSQLTNIFYVIILPRFLRDAI